MEREVNDHAVVERVQNGDKQAFNLLVAKYQFRIQNLVSRFIKDRAEQEDVTQEAFIKAYRAIGNFRGDSAFYTWLYRIAVNTAKNQIVGAGRRPPTQDMDVDDTPGIAGSPGLTELNSPDAILQNDEMVTTIRTAIAGLPDELREAITLREFDGLSYEDIADVMDCPIGTVRSRIFRAREAIEQAIEQPLK